MGSGLNKIRNRDSYANRKGYSQFIKSDKYLKLNSIGLVITYEEYITILKESSKEINEIILTNELGFKIPNNLGYIAITKFKQKDSYRVTDWKNTNLHNKEIPILNLHTMGYMFRFKLYKNQRCRPLRPYFIQMHRIVKRELAKRLKEGKQPYIELTNSHFNMRYNIFNIIKK